VDDAQQRGFSQPLGPMIDTNSPVGHGKADVAQRLGVGALAAGGEGLAHPVNAQHHRKP
jgi:hypothetical protein